MNIFSIKWNKFGADIQMIKLVAFNSSVFFKGNIKVSFN